MENKYLDYKKEIEKINQRIGYLWKKWYFSKLEIHNNRMLESNFWHDKINSKKIVKEKSYSKI